MLAIAPSRPIEYLLEFCQRQGHHRSASQLAPELLAESQAAGYGPSSAECATCTQDGGGYSGSVLARAKTAPPGGWLERIRLYREGLAAGKWKLADKLRGYATEGDHFKCPVTVIFGQQDPALEPAIVLDGIGKYFQNGAKATPQGVGGKHGHDSHVVHLPACGHWSPLEQPVSTPTQARFYVRSQCEWSVPADVEMTDWDQRPGADPSVGGERHKRPAELMRRVEGWRLVGTAGHS